MTKFWLQSVYKVLIDKKEIGEYFVVYDRYVYEALWVSRNRDT